MLAVLHLVLVAALAVRLRARVALLRDFDGVPGCLLSFGVGLFLVTWIDFACYALCGWGALYDVLAWTALVAGVVWVFRASAPRLDLRAGFSAGFILLFALVVSRFVFGVLVDRDGTVWCNFNFVDTAFHLSVAQAFLTAPHFPPVDLDMAPFPLKYHFLADFAVAHLARLGLTPLAALRVLNVLSAAALVGAVWATFARWLGLSSRWTLLAALLLLFLNPALLNVVHWLALHPPFFNPANPFDGLLHFPYFNFEFTLNNLLEPQRGLLFSLPVILLGLHAAVAASSAPAQPVCHALRDIRSGTAAPASAVLVPAFALICLLPLAHIIGFVVLALTLAPLLFLHRAAFLRAWPRWLPFFLLGLAQLYYLLAYGPPGNRGFSGWDVATQLPLGEFAAFPAGLRRVAFWIFADGDFLLWGALFALLAFLTRGGRAGPLGPPKSPLAPASTPGAPGGCAALPESPSAAAPAPLRTFLRTWRWFFAATLACFVLINFYRYSFAWGDSNKFVFFLNLALALLIALGAATVFPPRPARFAFLSPTLWWFFFVLCVAPPAYEFHQWIIASPHAKIILFHKNTRAAAAWLRTNTAPSAIVLTAAFNDTHFVTPLAGRRTLAGIYSDSNPYLQNDRAEKIRRVYEEADFATLRTLGVRYVCVSGGERLRYQLAPRWIELMSANPALLFHNGDGPADHFSVYLFDTARLPDR